MIRPSRRSPVGRPISGQGRVDPLGSRPPRPGYKKPTGNRGRMYARFAQKNFGPKK